MHCGGKSVGGCATQAWRGGLVDAPRRRGGLVALVIVSQISHNNNNGLFAQYIGRIIRCRSYWPKQ
ncbi:MAG: hypothetical protein ACPGWR_25140 [Ardenticatenaceae bacterium]